MSKNNLIQLDLDQYIAFFKVSYTKLNVYMIWRKQEMFFICSNLFKNVN